MRTLLFILIIYLAACMRHSDADLPPAYNEGELKAFVFSTTNNDEGMCLRKLDSILATVAPDSIVFRKTMAYLETPFGDPNSSYRNEHLYMRLLEQKLKSNWFIDSEKESVRARLNLVLQNTVGGAANDFVYTTPAGYKKRLYDIRSEYTLIFFYNPECGACKEMSKTLISSPIINNKINSSALQILAVYTDKDEQIWLDHLAQMPVNWIHGRDSDEYLYKYNVYDLKAMPTIYLLDKDKKVVLKDCTSVSAIEKILSK